MRYAPTVGLAVPYSRVHKPRPTIGVVLGKLHPHDDDAVAPAAFEQLGRAVSGAVALPRSLPASSSVYRTLLDGLIVFDDIEPADGPYDWSPAQIDRGKPGSALASWFTLPWGGPEQVILPGFHTLAESGLRKGSAAGNDLFLSLCGLMSSGARTILISRWRTGGQTSFDLVREFAQELPHSTPAEAWQRSVQIAIDTPIEPDREPRLKKHARRRAAQGQPSVLLVRLHAGRFGRGRRGSRQGAGDSRFERAGKGPRSPTGQSAADRRHRAAGGRRARRRSAAREARQARDDSPRRRQENSRHATTQIGAPRTSRRHASQSGRCPVAPEMVLAQYREAAPQIGASPKAALAL